MAKMTITIPDELLAKLNKLSEETYIPKSTLLQISLEQYIQSRDLIKDLPLILTKLSQLTEDKKPRNKN